MIKVAAVIAVALSMTSCLEKLPGGYILEEDAMQTLSDAEQTLTGIYTAYMSGALYSGYLTLCPDIQADLVYAVQGNTNQYGTHWLWDIRSTNSEIESVYAALYRVIGRCNFYLDQVDKLRSSMTDDEDIKYLDFYTGEVYCARALAYSELLKCYCKAYDPATAENELGVVLADTYFGQKPAARASLKDSYEFVIRLRLTRSTPVQPCICRTGIAQSNILLFLSIRMLLLLLLHEVMFPRRRPIWTISGLMILRTRISGE